MNCNKVKQLIPAYLEDSLPDKQRDAISMHIKGCIECHKQFEADKKIWDALSLWEGIKPEPGYISRFWTRLSLSETWYERILRKIKYILGIPYRVNLVSVTVVTLIIIVIGTGSLYLYSYRNGSNNAMISQLNKEGIDIDMLDNIDLVENYDLIAHLDLFEDMDILEKLDFSDV